MLLTGSDAQLTDLAAAAIAHPKVEPADSFVLHAPLELLARTSLLPLVEHESRPIARQRLTWLAATYESAGEEIDDPAPRDYRSSARALADLVAAIDHGELDDADAAAAWVAEALTPSELSRALAADVLPRLSAAGHGSIFLYLLPRVAPRSRAVARTLRGLVRELARYPTWVLRWHQERPPGKPEGPETLLEALRRPPVVGDVGSSFIFPTMSMVESTGLATRLLDRPTRSSDVRVASRELFRIAARSMLVDDPDHAPYGWSHCLTMPQGALGIAEHLATPRDGIAVAATYVLGFRSTLGTVDVDPAWAPPPPSSSEGAAQGSPSDAAARAWHTAPGERPDLVARLASFAAIHPDAHLAKYTLACFDAAADDPEATHLYLAAAAYLAAWWEQHPPASDPLLPARH